MKSIFLGCILFVSIRSYGQNFSGKIFEGKTFYSSHILGDTTKKELKLFSKESLLYSMDSESRCTYYEWVFDTNGRLFSISMTYTCHEPPAEEVIAWSHSPFQVLSMFDQSFLFIKLGNDDDSPFYSYVIRKIQVVEGKETVIDLYKVGAMPLKIMVVPK